MNLFTATFTDIDGERHTDAICTISFIFRGEWENKDDSGAPSDGETTVTYQVRFWPCEQDRTEGVNGQDYLVGTGNTLTLLGDVSGDLETLTMRCQAHFLDKVVLSPSKAMA